MEYTDKEYCLEVWGPMACFTRPELKVERVSYDVITPSAARAIFEAILFKKYAMRWQITKIEVLNPIQWISVRRNEVGAVISENNPKPIYIDNKTVREQRNSLMLRDVRYRIHAKLVFIPIAKRPSDEAFSKHQPGKDENPSKYYKMFERRAMHGQCFTQPYLGTRECSAMWQLVDLSSEKLVPAISESKDFGLMLYDFEYVNLERVQAMFYRAQMTEGIINVPELNSKEILR